MPSAPSDVLPTDDELGQLLEADSMRRVPLVLPFSQCHVIVRAYQRVEVKYSGELPANFRTVPNKAAVALEGKAVYPEFAIVRRLEAAGWDAAWRKNWHGAAFWSDIGAVKQIPIEVLTRFNAIADRAVSGAWDIIGWKESQMLFIESKQYGSDKLTMNQLQWLEAALNLGVPLASFAIFEYRARPVASPQMAF